MALAECCCAMIGPYESPGCGSQSGLNQLDTVECTCVSWLAGRLGQEELTRTTLQDPVKNTYPSSSLPFSFSVSQKK